ncbi:L-fucose isomerase [Phocaeicola salanitronis DSM 18170]|uniref:L-fucose isomerase n=1 Tax=Phocaeicola salanitronis (strain DSM 18170 / JCM 13657 / CCUG 60908 / BL78) TaxID=667015 RepID=F0R3A7_PHOSB|nr:fucose isomerase [Phocaeicola salanitronis]ADY35516.1 L-fucose isomerase [Phocaeicola salanitronis DSM 18170]
MDLYLLIFTTGTYIAEQTYESHKELFIALEKHFTLHLVNYTKAETIPSNAYKMGFIGSGGVEDKVIQNFSSFSYPITLLTDGLNNSLAAALEVSACFGYKDMKVRIIHGSIPEMVEQVLIHHRAFAAKRSLKGKRIGVIGTPAPWLVASHVDYLLASQRWGVTYVDIPIEEVFKRFYAITDDEIGMQASIFANRAKACQDTTPDDLLRAMRLYKAVKDVCAEQKLDAVTLSSDQCISQLNATGNVTSALLTDEGIPAGGEGDLQTIMTMLMAYAITGKPTFMGNPSFIDRKRNELILAHCSVPTKMVDEFIIRDHFETGRGIGLQGLMHEGDITLFKCGGECLDEYYVSEGYLVENTNLISACRTQFRLKMNKPVDYFLNNPIGNHHVLIQGHHAAALQEFMQLNRCKLRE